MPRHLLGPTYATAWVTLVLFALAASPAVAREIGPGADFCGAINRLAPGEELVLTPGDYQGPCMIRAGGRPGAPIVVTSKGSGTRPRIICHGRNADLIEIRASHVTLRGLRFGPTGADVGGVQIYDGSGVTIEQCEFAGVGGSAVVANQTNTLYGNREGGIILPDYSVQGRVVILNSAIHAPPGVSRLPEPASGMQMLGNVDCSSAPCFRNPEARDFSPFLGSPLIGPAVQQVERWIPKDDFFGTRRGPLPTVGAIERPSGPIPLGIKP